MKLLTVNQVKMLKSEHYRHLSAILQLKPAFSYKGFKTCPDAGKCAATCLAYAGLNRFGTNAQERRTRLFVDDPALFFNWLERDISSLIKKGKQLNRPVTVRLNGLSDIPWENYRVYDGKHVFDRFPTVNFIDYTKSEERALNHSRFPISNYSLTYSHNEKSNPLVEDTLLKRGMNIAVVFNVKKGNRLPESFNDCPVIDGDLSDLRHLDPAGVIVGLRYKKSFNPKTRKARLPVINGFIN